MGTIKERDNLAKGPLSGCHQQPSSGLLRNWRFLTNQKKGPGPKVSGPAFFLSGAANRSNEVICTAKTFTGFTIDAMPLAAVGRVHLISSPLGAFRQFIAECGVGPTTLVPG